mmetsp:Transcript_13142/g.18841  ORF Transcript_13142/g.18841 Transcript_13142/m.18841 type:complete len:109 (+) Transcript_13142:128-454(+)
MVAEVPVAISKMDDEVSVQSAVSRKSVRSVSSKKSLASVKNTAPETILTEEAEVVVEETNEPAQEIVSEVEVADEKSVKSQKSFSSAVSKKSIKSVLSKLAEDTEILA